MELNLGLQLEQEPELVLQQERVHPLVLVQMQAPAYPLGRGLIQVLVRSLEQGQEQ